MKYEVALTILSLWFIEELLSIPLDDPSEWPGHLEAFGSKQNAIPIKDILYHWPSPKGIPLSSHYFNESDLSLKLSIL